MIIKGGENNSNILTVCILYIMHIYMIILYKQLFMYNQLRVYIYYCTIST